MKKTIGLIVLAGGLTAACAVEPAGSPAPTASASADAIPSAPTLDLSSVHVVSEYSAASGRPCREYIVDGDKQKHVACASGNGWVEIRPLIRAERSPTPVP